MNRVAYYFPRIAAALAVGAALHLTYAWLGLPL